MLETFLAFLVGWPILVCLVLGGLMLVLLATDHEFIGTLLLLGLGGLVVYSLHATGEQILWGKLAMYVGAYLFVGFLFCWVKWYFWTRKMGRKFKEIKAGWRAVNDAEAKAEFDRKRSGSMNYNDTQTFNEYKHLLAEHPDGLPDPKLYDVGHGKHVSSSEYARMKLVMDQGQMLVERQQQMQAKVVADYETTFIDRFEDHWNRAYSRGVMRVAAVDRDTTWAEMRFDVTYDKVSLVSYLTSWIINWPFHAALLLLEDFIVEVVNWIADHVGKTFKAMATNAFNQA